MMSASVLLEKLRDADPGIRRNAVRELISYPEPQVIEALAESLGDQNKGVQNSAMDVLSRMRSPNVVMGLIPVIRGFDLNTRNAGMTILKNLGPMAIDPLIEAVKKASDVDEIIQILVVLGNIGSPLATDTVLSYVGHEDDNVKTTAVEALGKIQDPKAVKTLINTYHQTDILKYSVVEALGNVSVKDAVPVLLGAVDSEDVLEYFSGISAMGAMEDPSFIEPLFKKLMKEDDSGTRRLIIKSMAQIEDANPGCLGKLDRATIRPVLTSLLEQSDAAEFIYIVKVTAALQDETFVPQLVAALEHSEAEVQNSAFQGILTLGAKAIRPVHDKIGRVSPAELPRLLEFLEKVLSSDTPQAILPFCEHPADAVRQGLARTFGANPSDTSFNALKKMLSDVDETVRRLAVVGLTKMLSYDGALSALFGALKDSNGHVRREAALAMRGTTSPQVVEPLMTVLLTEPYGDVREAAALVLAGRKDPDITKKLLELLDSENSRIRETVAKTIWECGWALAVETLIRKLVDKEWRVVVNACFSLEKMKDPKSIFPLKELLKNNDWQIRIAALSALKAFKSKELKQSFVPLVEDSNTTVAKLAVESLSEMEDKSLEETFRKHLNHPRWEVRYHIIKALGKIQSQKAVDSLISFVENDPNNGVRSKALLALARIKDKKACKPALALLGHEDRDLVISAMKFFLQFENPEVPDLEDRLKKIMLANPFIKIYFITSFAENKCLLLENVLKAVSTPRELRKVEKLKNATVAGGITSEEAFLLQEIVAEKCGIAVADRKQIERQLSKDLAKFSITSWIEYYHALKYGSDEQNVLIGLYDSITDPRTGFFLEPEQNKVLVEHLIPELIEEKSKAGSHQVRILSCGSSFGPESYSLAMSILEDVHSDKVKVSVVGVDLSHICLNTAKRGIYKREILRNVDQKFVDVYFEDDRGDLRIKDEVKNMVEFKYVNLATAKDVEVLGHFDVIVCRNVFSAFTLSEREKLAENLYNALAPGGSLLIGNKETLYNVTKAFKLQTHEKVVVYKKA
jgi:chemotaxis protein methyltransferase CheR